MFKDFLDALQQQLLQECQNTSVELFLRDISQYKYISQKPVLVINFRGADLYESPHPSVLEQKSDLQVSFFYFSRTLENAYSDGVFEIFETIRNLDRTKIQSLKPYSHKKNVSVWEIKAQMMRVI